MTTDRRFRRGWRSALVLLAATALVAGCGDDDDTEPVVAGDGSDEAIDVDEAWARSSPMVASAGAVYMTIENEGDADDALVGVAVDEAVAAKAELHETVAVGDGDTTMGDHMSSDTTAGGSGMMTMQPVDEIAVPADGEAVLQPGGYHVMLLELVEPLEVGDEVELTLTFERAGDVDVVAEVREAAEM